MSPKNHNVILLVRKLKALLSPPPGGGLIYFFSPRGGLKEKGGLLNVKNVIEMPLCILSYENFIEIVSNLLTITQL